MLHRPLFPGTYPEGKIYHPAPGQVNLDRESIWISYCPMPPGGREPHCLGLPDRFDVYYGMADNRIGVARLDLPDVLPPSGMADPPEAKV